MVLGTILGNQLTTFWTKGLFKNFLIVKKLKKQLKGQLINDEAVQHQIQHPQKKNWNQKMCQCYQQSAVGALLEKMIQA